MESCPVLCEERLTASRAGAQLHILNGIEMHEDLFAKPKVPVIKAAKLNGFVMSNTVLMDNPLKAPTLAQLKAGVRTGRKGYVRCLSCNAEVFAPNTKRHAQVCGKSQT